MSFILVSSTLQGPASHSRFVKHEVVAPPAKGEEVVEFLLQIIQQYKIPLAIPASDQALVLFDRWRSSLEGHTRLAMANPQAVRNVLDKRLNLELAQGLGVPCPRQFELQDVRQIPEMIKALGLPIVLKRSGVPKGPNIPDFNFKVLYAHSEQQLRGLYRRTLPARPLSHLPGMRGGRRSQSVLLCGPGRADRGSRVPFHPAA